MAMMILAPAAVMDGKNGEVPLKFWAFTMVPFMVIFHKDICWEWGLLSAMVMLLLMVISNIGGADMFAVTTIGMAVGQEVLVVCIVGTCMYAAYQIAVYAVTRKDRPFPLIPFLTAALAAVLTVREVLAWR